MTDTLAQDIVEGRIKYLPVEVVIYGPWKEPVKETIEALVVPFGEDPIAPDAHTFGG